MRVKGKWHNLASYRQTVADYSRAIDEGNWVRAANIYVANQPIQRDLDRISASVPNFNPLAVVIAQAA